MLFIFAVMLSISLKKLILKYLILSWEAILGGDLGRQNRVNESDDWLAQLVERQTGKSKVRAPDRTNTQGRKIAEKNVVPL